MMIEQDKMRDIARTLVQDKYGTVSGLARAMDVAPQTIKRFVDGKGGMAGQTLRKLDRLAGGIVQGDDALEKVINFYADDNRWAPAAIELARLLARDYGVVKTKAEWPDVLGELEIQIEEIAARYKK